MSLRTATAGHNPPTLVLQLPGLEAAFTRAFVHFVGGCSTLPLPIRVLHSSTLSLQRPCSSFFFVLFEKEAVYY